MHRYEGNYCSIHSSKCSITNRMSGNVNEFKTIKSSFTIKDYGNECICIWSSTYLKDRIHLFEVLGHILYRFKSLQALQQNSWFAYFKCSFRRLIFQNYSWWCFNSANSMLANVSLLELNNSTLSIERLYLHTFSVESFKTNWKLIILST